MEKRKRKGVLFWNLISVLGGFDILFIPWQLIDFSNSNLMSWIGVCGWRFTLVNTLLQNVGAVH
jgi:hypothetical protein